MFIQIVETEIVFLISHNKTFGPSSKASFYVIKWVLPDEGNKNTSCDHADGGNLHEPMTSQIDVISQYPAFLFISNQDDTKFKILLRISVILHRKIISYL